jgi:hypothetical protein
LRVHVDHFQRYYRMAILVSHSFEDLRLKEVMLQVVVLLSEQNENAVAREPRELADRDVASFLNVP